MRTANSERAFFGAMVSCLASLAAAAGNKAALADAHRAQNILNGDGDEEGNIVPQAPPAVAPQEAEMHVTLPKSETDSSDEIPDVDLTVESDPPAPPTQTTPAVAPPAPEGSDKHSCSAPAAPAVPDVAPAAPALAPEAPAAPPADAPAAPTEKS